MRAIPAPLEIEELASELVAIIANELLDTARVRQIQVRATRLKNTGASDPLLANVVLFLCAYQQGDRVAAHSIIEEINPVAVGDREILLNALIVFTALGSYKEALRLIDVAVAAFPGDKEVLEAATIHSQICLQFKKSLKYCDEYEKIAIHDLPRNWQKLRDTSARSLMVANEYGFDDMELLARLETAVDAVRSQGFEVRRQSRHALDDGTFISQLFIDASPRVCADLNFDIADALLDNFDDTAISVFSVVCRPLSDFAQAGRLKVHG